MAIASGNIVTATDIYNQFVSVIQNPANSGIVYGTNNYHFSDLPTTGINLYGGTTGGLGAGGTGINSGDIITASTIVNYVTANAAAFCRIRNMSVTRNVSASGGPAATSSTNSGITHMAGAYAAPFTNPTPTGVQSSNIVAANELNNFYTNCYNNYTTARNNTYSYSYTVCHNSCHSSCHGSRGRR